MNRNNITYKVEIQQLKPEINKAEFEQYKFKDRGYLVLYSKSKGEGSWSFHGFITLEDIKIKLGIKAYSQTLKHITNERFKV